MLSPPITPTQRWVLSHRLLHVLPIAGFQAASWARLTLYLDPIAVQPSPETTRWNRLQLPTMPSWVGVGVWTPFPALVVVAGGAVVVEVVVEVVVLSTGGWPQFCSMQYEFPSMSEQVLARDGFYRKDKCQC